MANSCRRVQLGFTLIEVLIALAITAMVVAVLMSSVFYGGKVQSAIRSELVEREQLLRSKAWFVELLSTCLPSDATSTSAFSGTEQQVVCESLMPLRGNALLSSQRIMLALRSAPQHNLQLLYSAIGSAAAPVVIADLPFISGQFSYYGNKGVEVAKWPLQINDPETLPRRVHLTLRAGVDSAPDAVWVVSLRASPWLEPKAAIPFLGEALR